MGTGEIGAVLSGDRERPRSYDRSGINNIIPFPYAAIPLNGGAYLH
jgi:hypothetical protein